MRDSVSSVSSISSKDNIYTRVPFENKSKKFKFLFISLDTTVPQTKMDKSALDKIQSVPTARSNAGYVNSNANLLKKDKKDCIIY